MEHRQWDWPRAGRRTHTTATAAEQAASRHRVRAEITQDAQAAFPSADGVGSVEKYRVPVRWATLGGGFGSGFALVRAGSGRGDRTDAWLDSRGRVTTPPKQDADIWLSAFAIGSGGAAGSAVIVVIVRHAVRRACDRHTMAEWEQEWALIGPKWSGHRA